VQTYPRPISNNGAIEKAWSGQIGLDLVLTSCDLVVFCLSARLFVTDFLHFFLFHEESVEMSSSSRAIHPVSILGY
jgi:hypothetical protein